MADLKARSRARWRERGYHVENAETILRVPGGIVRRQDIFGFTDLIAVPETRADLSWMPESEAPVIPGNAMAWIWIQSTSWGNVSSRLRKIQNETTGSGQWERPIAQLARAVLERGDLVLIEGWKKKGGRYVVREHWLTLEEL